MDYQVLVHRSTRSGGLLRAIKEIARGFAPDVFRFHTSTQQLDRLQCRPGEQANALLLCT
jgi:hypothetical protein